MAQLKCASMLGKECNDLVTHIDNRGYVYCKACGTIRRLYSLYGMKVRQLKPSELKSLENGELLTEY